MLWRVTLVLWRDSFTTVGITGVHLGDSISNVGDNISTVEDSFSTVEGIQYIRGYLQYCEGCSVP